MAKMGDFTTTHRLWEKWASKNVDSASGEPLKRRFSSTTTPVALLTSCLSCPLSFGSDAYNGSLPSLASNIIFLDSPISSGFSFVKHSQGYLVGDITSSKQVHKFVLKWFADHLQFLSNHFYFAGDSNAGKVIPIIIEDIPAGVEGGYQPFLNLKGYLAGNPVTEEKIDYNSRFPYLHGVGIISDEQYEDKANPFGAILSSAMLLRYELGEEAAARRIEVVVLKTLDRGFQTGGIYAHGKVLVRCKRIGEEVLKYVDSEEKEVAVTGSM